MGGFEKFMFWSGMIFWILITSVVAYQLLDYFDVGKPTSTSYIEEDESGYTFDGNECLEDCEGHQAGYDWAAEKGISDPEDCGGNSESFIEGCRTYAEE